MSTAQSIVEDAFTALGSNSEVKTVSTTLVDDGFIIFQGILANLIKNDIILSETVSGTTTTIAVPTAKTDELNEPLAARYHLVNYLAVYLIPTARTPAETLKVPPAPFSLNELASLYQVHVIPNKIMSRLLPRGQGSQTRIGERTFFNGQTIANDTTSTT